MATTDTMPDLPRYQSHKVVQAGKIISITPPVAGTEADEPALLDVEGIVVQVMPEWVAKHSPEVGGYFVRYADGYESYSPAQAFESGYTPLSDDGKESFEAAARRLAEENIAQAHKIADLEMALEDAVTKAVSDSGFGDEFEKFVRAHAGEPLRVVVAPRTNLLRLATMDQTQVLEGAVLGNVFQPKR